jgi:hypothetical protein
MIIISRYFILLTERLPQDWQIALGLLLRCGFPLEPLQLPLAHQVEAQVSHLYLRGCDE